MRVTMVALLCALKASSVAAFTGPYKPSSPAVRIAKSPVWEKYGSMKPAPKTLAARPQPLYRRDMIRTRSLALPAPEPISNEDKRRFVRWSYLLCLANSLVNSATLIQFGEVVMHMTGPSTKGPLFLASGLAAQGWHNLGTIASFLFGCVFAGLATAQADGNTPIKKTGVYLAAGRPPTLPDVPTSSIFISSLDPCVSSPPPLGASLFLLGLLTPVPPNSPEHPVRRMPPVPRRRHGEGGRPRLPLRRSLRGWNS